MEAVVKDLLDVRFHPVNTFHPHRQSLVGALTLGYVRDLLRSKAGTFGSGGDLTACRTPVNLAQAYGTPLSYHAFVRYCVPTLGGGTSHIH